MKTPIHNIFSETGCIRREVLDRYRDHKISVDEKHEVERHLVDCDLCSEALEGLALATSASILDDVRKKVTEQTTGESSEVSYPTGRLLLVAASISLVAFLSYFTWQQYDKAVTPTNILTQAEVDKEEAPIQKAYQSALTTDSNANQQSVPTELKEDKRVSNGIYSPKPDEEFTKVETADVKITDDEQVFENDAEPEIIDVALEDNYESTIEKSEFTTTNIHSGSISSGNKLFSPSTTQSNVSYLNNHKVYIEPTSKKLKKNSSVRSKSVSPKYENKEALSVSEEPSISREELSYEKALELALIDFGNNNYDEALRKLKTIEQVHPKDKNVEFYSGMSNYNLSNYSDALSSLEILSNDDAGVFNEEAEYYTALSYYKSGYTKKGIIMLENIETNGGFYSKDAQQFLQTPNK